jgi:iron only hydrogenase large subunit-like protein
MSSDGYYHAHEINASACTGRMKCMRACPTGAIRVREGRASMIEELCVDCGECMKACPNGAVVPLADSLGPRASRYECRIAIPSPVLYSQFPSDVSPRRILKGLERIGFDYVFDVARACDWGALAIRIFLREHTGPWPMVSPFCPAVVRLIQVKYPDLVDRILPLELPREITARGAKKRLSQELEIDETEIEAAYITPCPAKVVSIRQPAEKKRSRLDTAIAISHVYGPLRAELSAPEERVDDDLFDDATYGSGWSRLGALTSLLSTEKWIAVSGMNDVTAILDDIENSRLRNVEFIEASACLGGCVGGPLTVENIYVARSRTIHLATKYGQNVDRHGARVERLYREGYFAMESPFAPRPLSPLDADIGRAIAKIAKRDEIYAELPKIDCGACGSPSCLAFAEDVVKGDVGLDRCIVSPRDGAC